MGLEEKKSSRYVYILGSDGTLRESVTEGTEGAVKRDYETSDGKTGTKWEKVYKSLGGKIADVNLRDGDYGTQVQIAVDCGEPTPIILSVATNSPYGEDIMKKLPSINYNEHVVFTPACFEKKNGKMAKYVKITQGDTEVADHYTPYSPDGYQYLNGVPEPKGDTEKYTTEKWSLYFATVRDFLVDETRANILPKFGHTDDIVMTGDENF